MTQRVAQVRQRQMILVKFRPEGHDILYYTYNIELTTAVGSS